MKNRDTFTFETDALVPQGDAARQAVDSLRGYVYQVTAAALAWLDVKDSSKIFLEVAEDYAQVAKNAITAVQVKDTQASGAITLNTDNVREAILSFVKLTELNDGADVHLRYFTTSEIGKEKALRDRPNGIAGLSYWRSVAKGADATPLRKILDSDKFPDPVRLFVRSREDDELRRDLFHKIHWDCGKPNLASLRKEFQERLVVVAHDVFNMSTQDIPQLSSLLIHHVLKKSIESSTNDRVLTRAALYSVADNYYRVSVPRATLDNLTNFSSRMISQMMGSADAGLPVTVGRPAWLVDGSDLPAAKRAVPRPKVEKAIEDRLRTHGACFVSGSSGVGKSSVSRAVAERVSENYFIVDFRDADTEKTRGQLNALLARLGGIRAQVIILEDLNQLNTPGLASLAGQVFEALSRRDIAVIATSYTIPTSTALLSVGHDPGSTIDCPYFSEEESASLVGLHGGDANLWGKLAHVSGAFGHPQLVHAFIAGMAARGWPRSEIRVIIGAGLSTGDIVAEREAARRSLISVLPESSRNLLYRLSIMIGSFNRAVALNIATAPPPIAQSGEALDALIGSWVETTGRDSYRVSPLVGQSGKDMLNPKEQQAIHCAIALQITSGGPVNAWDVDRIILHAMLGKNESVLVSLTRKLLNGDSHQIISFLAESLALLGLFKVEKPIYPDNIYISVVLRLVQFRVLAAGKEKERIEPCVRALLRESAQIEPENRKMVQIISLLAVLSTMGIANHLENWVELLLLFHAISSDNKLPSELLANLEAGSVMGNGNVEMLFTIGSSNLTSVAKLEHVVDQLDRLEPKQREMLLRPVGEITSDYSVLVNSPWMAERHNGLDALDAAERYRRMAARTSTWGFRQIMIQCWIARAVMLDEYGDDFEGALNVLDEAAAKNGEDVLIDRARAKVYWRAQDHKRALSILRRIADVVGKGNNVERAFALREAAISAANCDDWAQAEEWFLESKVSASAIDLPDMPAISVGLGADAAVAAFMAGQTERCLKGLANALIALGRIKPEASLQCVHCHLLVRLTIWWLQSRMEGGEVMVGGEPLSIQPGICSNPEPAKQIEKCPLESIDIAWYKLAHSELMSRTNVGIMDGLADRINGGPIPIQEIRLRSKRLGIEIEDMNPAGFTRHLLSHVEGMAYLSNHAQEINRESNSLNPARTAIPALSPGFVQATLANFVNDAVLAYAISCACRQKPDSLLELTAALDQHFGQGVMGEAIFSRAISDGDKPRSASFEDVLIDYVMTFRPGVHATPKEYCLAGLRFLLQAQNSSFRSSLVPIIAKWQRDAWKRIVASERFQLVQPQRTVPAIEVSLSLELNNEVFLCSLLLAAADASDVAIPNDVRTRFKKIAVDCSVRGS